MGFSSVMRGCLGDPPGDASLTGHRNKCKHAAGSRIARVDVNRVSTFAMVTVHAEGPCDRGNPCPRRPGRDRGGRAGDARLENGRSLCAMPIADSQKGAARGGLRRPAL